MKDYTKKQKILIILGVAVFILIGSGITYAALTWSSGNINTGLTSGCFEINYTLEGTINNTSSSTTLTVAGLKGQSFDIVKKGIITSTGLKNDTTRNMIAETTYYTRGHNDNDIYVNAMYDKKRVSGTVYDSTRTTSWTGKVAVAYPSDYGYTADLSLCQQTLVYYEDSTCTANNWMKNIITNNGAKERWLLTPNSGRAVGNTWYVVSSAASTSTATVAMLCMGSCQSFL